MKISHFFILPCILAFLSFCSATVSAQEKRSLQDCINYALENNLQLRQSRLDIERNQLNYEQSKLERYPSLNGSASHSYNLGRSLDPFTNTFTNNEIRSNGFGLSTNMTLFNGFSIRNTIEQNSLNIEQSKKTVEASQNDLMLNIASAYLSLVLNTELLNSAKLQLNGIREQIERTEKLIKAGSLPESGIFSLRAQLATSELQITNAENSLTLSKLQLRQLMQLPPDESLEIVIPEIPDPETVSVPSDISGIYDNAQSTMPDVAAADIATESAKLGIEIAKGQKLPSLSLFGSANTGYSSVQDQFFEGDGSTSVVELPIGYLANDPTQIILTQREVPNGEVVDFGFFRQLRESFRQNIGLSLNIPIFNRGRVDNQIQLSRIAHRNAQINSDIVRNNLRQTIEQAYADARVSKASYESNKRRVDALEKALEATKKSFELGRANATDFNLAKNDLDLAMNDLLRSKYDFIFRVKVLEFYQGKGLDF